MKLSLTELKETELPVVINLFYDGGSIYISANGNIIASISPDGYLKRVKIKHPTRIISLGFKVKSGYIELKDTEIYFSTQG